MIAFAKARIAGIALGCVTFAAPDAGAQATTGHAAIAGVVRDTAGRPLSFATVLATDSSVVTDDSGRFHLGGISPGVQSFTILRLGYAPVTFETTLSPDSTVVLRVTLKPVQTLSAVETRAFGVDRGLRRVGFYERMRSARGSYVPPERIDSLSHVVKPSSFLRDVRGVEVHCPAGAGACIVQSRMEPSCLTLYVDGTIVSDQLDNILTPAAIAAIEVYPRPSQVPIQFQGKLPPKRGIFTVQAGCGALVVWTKGRVDRR